MYRFEELAPGIVRYTDVLEDPKGFITDLESLVEIGQLSWNSGTQSDSANDPTPKKNRAVRDCNVISLPKFDLDPNLVNVFSLGTSSVHNFLNDNLYGPINHYLDLYAAQQWKVSEGWQILKYGKDGHFVNHFDDSTVYPRTVSMSFYLNDDYEGGEIEFTKFGLKIKPQANEMIMFPSNYVYTHTVHPVVSGTRYAVVGWWDI
jgi:hypothetical protein